MAASSPGQDVKDPGYRNGLKVLQALLYMKRALHPFVRNEFNLIHKYLINTIYGGSNVQHSKCTRCKASDIKQHKHTHVWGFITAPCPELCHDWLTELLNLFNNPRSDRIYWSNCDVPSWAYNAWECAKAFMPRGQKPTNTDPNESDAQALLALMANCKHFHRFFSTAGIQQIRKVSDVRNTIMHAPQMKLTDAEMRSCIQEIIDLLEDPVHLLSLSDCIAAVSNIKQELHQDIDSNKSDLSGLHQKMDSQKSDLQRLHQDMDLQKSELLGLCQDTKSHKSDLRELQQDMDLQKSDLQGLHQEMSEVKGIHQEVYSQKSDLEVIHKDIDSQNIRIGHSEGQIKLGERKCDIRHRQLHSKVRKLAKQIVVSQGRRKGSRQPTEKGLQGIQLLLIEAYERVQIISVSPVFENGVNLKDLKDFYTDLVIEEEREESVQMWKGKQMINKNKVTSFRQIFFKGDKKVTRIILKGPAGQGKSTFCRKLVHAWCSCQKKKFGLINASVSDKSETYDLENEEEMLKFDVLLYICLRDISDEKTLMDAIYTQFPLHESQDLSHRSHIEELIGQTVENKVLLIMDGLDEMANSSFFIKQIMQKSLYPYLTVLATTRPWKIDQLDLITSAETYLLLDLQGFSYENSMLFAERILDKYYKDKSVTEQFKKDISNNSVIRSLIHVPLLLLFIVHVWYEKKSFPQTLHELYFDILNIVVNRYKECKERNKKCKGRQDKRKGQSENMSFTLTPKLRNLSLVQHFGEEFLADLCEVANHFLITDAEECSLVFEEEALLKLLGNIGLHVALDLGIFTKLESPGIFTKRICLTFLHKTVQEFLAAINICCSEGKCDTFLDSLNTLDGVFKNEMVIMFVAGISTSHCEKIFEKIYDLCDKDLDFDRALTMVKSDLFFINYPRDLCRLYRDCIREACGEPISLKLKYLYAKNKKEWNVLLHALGSKSGFRLSCFGNFFSQLTHISLEGLMLNGLMLTHISLRCCSIDDTKLDLSQSTCLVYLSLRKVTMKGKLLLSKCTRLKSMTLISCRLRDATMDLSEFTSLSEFRLQNMSMNIKLLPSKCTQLKCLKLFQSSLNDTTLDLSESASLTKLGLKDMIMKGKFLLSKCIQLKCLKLSRCNFIDATLDLSECTSLTEFNLEHVTMNGTLLMPMFTQLKCLNLIKSDIDHARIDLSDLSSLNQTIFTRVSMKGKLLLSRGNEFKHLPLGHCSLDDVTLDLSKFSKLTQLILENGTIKGKLFLSVCTCLKYLQLIKCRLDDVTLNLSESNCLAMLRLEDVTVKGKLLIPKCIHLKLLKMVKCSLDDTTLDLSESIRMTELSLKDVTMNGKLLLSKCTQLESLELVKSSLDDTTLDLSECTKLMTELCLKDVTMNGKLLLSKCTQLESLELVKCSLDDVTLDLSKYSKLTRLILENGTIKGKQFLSVCTCLKYLQLIKCRLDDVTLNLCTQLKSLELVKCSLDNTTLDLSESTRMTEFSLKDVTMNGKLLLSKCTQLKSLELVKCSLDDTTLDLSESTRMTELSLKDVTMNGKLLLSKCTQLKSLELVKCSLDDTTLDLSESTRMTELSLKDVTMNGKLLLSKCTNLMSLTLNNISLDEFTLDFSGSTHLTNLILHDVTATGKSMLKISNCLQLLHVTLQSARQVIYAMLDLSCSTCLKQLVINNVILDDWSDSDNLIYSRQDVIHCDGKKEMLWNSISKCTKLQYLSLTNLNLGNAQLSLDNLKELNHFTVDNVTMCKDGYMMLCNSLSLCKGLRTSSLKNLDLNNALLSLDNLKELNHFTVDNVTMCKDGYMMLCNSLSQCKGLITLSLKNLDLNNALLSLDNLKELNHFTVDNVTMCKDGYMMLCNSLSQCKGLRTSSLKNLDLNNALLSLDNLKELNHFTVDNVTMCKDGYMMLCTSMSMRQKRHILLTLKTLQVKLVDVTISLQCVNDIKSLVQYTKHCLKDSEKLVIEKAADSSEKCVVNYTSLNTYFL